MTVQGTFRGKKLMPPEPQFEIRTHKDASRLTRMELDHWAGAAFDYYIKLNQRSQDYRIDVDNRRSDYQIGEVLYQCHLIIRLLLQRMGQRDQVIDQKSDQIARLREQLDACHQSQLQ